MKARSFFSAGVLLAVALIFSCSSSDDDNGGGGGGDDLPSSSSGGDNGGGGGSSPSGGIDLTNLPLSYDGRLEGKIDVFLVAQYANDRRYDTLPAGKIENGRLSLSLPSIDSKYLRSWYSEFGEDDEFSIVPQDLAIFNGSLIILGEGRCYIEGILKNEEMYKGEFALFYNSASGTATGTLNDSGGNQTIFNLNLSQGWQGVYGYIWNRDIDEFKNARIEGYWTTDLPANTTVEWTLGECSPYYDLPSSSSVPSPSSSSYQKPIDIPSTNLSINDTTFSWVMASRQDEVNINVSVTLTGIGGDLPDNITGFDSVLVKLNGKLLNKGGQQSFFYQYRPTPPYSYINVEDELGLGVCGSDVFLTFEVYAFGKKDAEAQVTKTLRKDSDIGNCRDNPS